MINLKVLTYTGNLESPRNVVDNSRYCLVYVDIRYFNELNDALDLRQVAEHLMSITLLMNQLILLSQMQFKIKVLVCACREKVNSLSS